ncbi:hypothetical protein D9M70_654540 [compost metagenome]
MPAKWRGTAGRGHGPLLRESLALWHPHPSPLPEREQIGVGVNAVFPANAGIQ